MTGRKKGVSIGAAMKQRMGTLETQAEEQQEIVQAVQLANPSLEVPAEVLEVADPLESFNTRLPRSLHRALKIHAAAEGLKIQDLVQHALMEYLSKK